MSQFLPLAQTLIPSIPSPVPALPTVTWPAPDATLVRSDGFSVVAGPAPMSRRRAAFAGTRAGGFVMAPLQQPLVNVLRLKSVPRDAQPLFTSLPCFVLHPSLRPLHLMLFALSVQGVS